MIPNPLKSVPANRANYWHLARRLTLLLLLSWFAVTFGVIFFARELSRVSLFGWPFSFYMAAQGTLLIYLIIVAVYAWQMKRLDNAYKNDGVDGE